MASGTSWALPSPTPTWPPPSPTTTSAVNENRRPPFTTLATRLMATTRSFNSSPLGSIRPSAMCSPVPPPVLEAQARRPRRVRQRLDAAVVLVAAAVEHDRPDPARLRLPGDQLPDRLRR